jgi:hypothetical protein
MTKSRSETFVGFAIKSGKCKIGTGAVETLRRAELVIVCNTASENTKKQAKKLANRLNAKLYTTVNKTLSQITFKENSKMMAILDLALANAIMSAEDGEFASLE